MADGQKFVQRLRSENPKFWNSLTQAQKDRFRRHADLAKTYAEFQKFVSAQPVYKQYQAGGDSGGSGVTPDDGEGVTPDDGEATSPDDDIPLPPPDPTTPPPPPLPPVETGDIDPQEDARDMLRQFLVDNELPITLMDFIENALAEKKSLAQIVLELRQTEEYLQAYPENALRREAGYSWIPEAQIRAYRDELSRLSRFYFGYTPTRDELAQVIATNKSPAEFEHLLQVQQNVDRYGAVVQRLFMEELGYELSADRLLAFMDPERPTVELDRAFEAALNRGRPASIGLGIRPEEEAELLRQFGINPEDAFRGYQGIAAELPRTERLSAIERLIDSSLADVPAGDLFREANIGLLFNAIQLGDIEAIQKLQGMMSREIARFQAGGGPARAGTGAVGLLTAAERQTL
jgi:hypothetical protein